MPTLGVYSRRRERERVRVTLPPPPPSKRRKRTVGLRWVPGGGRGLILGPSPSSSSSSSPSSVPWGPHARSAAPPEARSDPHRGSNPQLQWNVALNADRERRYAQTQWERAWEMERRPDQ
ncbi:unnamed protein product [Lampetra fluviatilis]